VSNEYGGSGDFLLVTDEGPFRRHRPLVITTIVVVVALLALVGWELIEGGGGSNASGAVASVSSPAVPVLRPSVSATASRITTTPSPATVTRTVTRTVPGPRVFVTVTATAAAPRTVIVPDVFKLTLSEATEVMRSLGFAVAPNAVTPPAGDDGSQTVVSQSPVQGAAVSPGATVTLNYYGSG
jgi:hypothetical protein